MENDMNYFWIRVFDYVYERDSNYESESFGKGVLLDEFYLKDIDMTREQAKQEVRNRYIAKSIVFAKPKRKDGIYAIVMDSEKFFYDRFCREIDTYCFWHECHRKVKGKFADFPKINLDRNYIDSNEENERFFCSYECKHKYYNALNPFTEGEFQEKEVGQNGGIFGYIYLIYNRAENAYYIGQTRFLPFFRWQEHVKSKQKGDIKELTFSVLTEVACNRSKSNEENQIYLNNIEAWWIAKYKEEGFEVFNTSNPKITLEYLKNSFDEMVKRNCQLQLCEMEGLE